MRIGELAQRAGTSARALRYYEEHGLVRPHRRANGYRSYDDAEVAIVAQIRELLDAGFDLDDIRPFVSCLRAGNGSGDVCPDSVSTLRRKLAEVDSYLARLEDVRRHLSDRLAAACEFDRIEETR
ncbi:MerR family transcriptional regulator [Nocardia asiatica]|uniref:MerR family transcriptional regulator n=1 Tax=Nocardia asiatica TaxID=209252 RepID=UPI00031E48FC|nr:MerR family transcriptional regulator [Nocardia asiatica]